MKHTEDGHIVADSEGVFEIRYHWYNAETSLAEPTFILANETDRKIWKFHFPCSMECYKLNKAAQYPSLIEPIPTVKMIAECHR